MFCRVLSHYLQNLIEYIDNINVPNISEMGDDMSKSQNRYIKKILAVMFIYLILFTCACLFITYRTGSEPKTLILCVFAFCGVEGGLSAWIKTTKVKKSDKTGLKDPEGSEGNNK